LRRRNEAGYSFATTAQDGHAARGEREINRQLQRTGAQLLGWQAAHFGKRGRAKCGPGASHAVITVL
jgi:hypothetical protein